MIILLSLLILSIGCGYFEEEEKDGKSLGIPELKPPIIESAPSGILNNSKKTKNLAETDLFQLKEYINQAITSAGLTDERMQGLNDRNLEFERKCTTEEPKAWNPELPENESFPMFFSCKEQTSRNPDIVDHRIYFGKKDNYAYIAEIYNEPAATAHSAILGRITLDGNEVIIKIIDAYTIDNYRYSSVNAQKDQKNMEYTLYSYYDNYTNFGLDIPLEGFVYTHIKSNKDNLYIYQNKRGTDIDTLNLPLTAFDYNTTDTACLDCINLGSSDNALCTGTSLDIFSLPVYTYEQVSQWNFNINNGIFPENGFPDNLTDFND